MNKTTKGGLIGGGSGAVGYSEYNDSLSPEQNRNVEVFMYASQQMIKNAEAGK